MNEYIAVQQAASMILEHITPVSRSEQVDLPKAVGRVLALDVTALADGPPFDRAAMDGYAFRAHETPGTLRVAGTLFAGHVWSRPLGPGEALRIMTGAPVPPALDTVLEQEAVQDGPNIAVLSPVKPGRNIMTKGHEYRIGAPVLRAGLRLTPLHIGQAAAQGLAHLSVLVRPRVLIVITGDEVMRTGRPPIPGHIYDASGPLLRALVENLGANPTLRYIGDKRRKLEQILADAPDNFQLVLTTGGVSVGLHDFLPKLLEERFKRLFWRVDMHPGKAMAAGLAAPGVPILALSGNPGASLTAWHLVAAPAVAALTGQPYPLRTVQGTLLQDYPKPTRETRYLKAQFVLEGSSLGFSLSTNQSSDALTSFAQADGLVVIPHGSPPQARGQTLSGIVLPK